MKKRNVFLCIILLLSLLNGCQSSPSKVVQNKNEAEFLEKASQKADTDNTADATQHIDFSDVFFNCMYSGSYRCIHFGSSFYEEVYRFFVTIGVIEVRKGY